jgi:glycyl-tRNA synthetase
MTAAPDPKLMDRRQSGQAARAGLSVVGDLRRFRSTWDYGPLGVLKRNVKDAWWRSMVQPRDDIVGLDASILMAPEGVGGERSPRHVHRPAVDRRNCKERFRADHSAGVGRAHCGAKGQLHGRAAQLDVQDLRRPGEDTRVGRASRPETAQGIFVNFKNVQTTTAEAAVRDRADRQVVPQRDHPGNFIFRTREFEQMEMESFPPEDGAGTSTGSRSATAGSSTLGIPESMLRDPAPRSRRALALPGGYE